MNIYTENQNDIIHETSVDFVLRPCTKEIHIVQYDKSLPVIKVELFRNGERYALPENAIVNVRVGKLDHTFVYESVLGTNEERNIVYFEVSEQMATIPGRIWPVLEVIETNKIACSSPLCFIIERNPIQEGQIESEDHFPIIYELQTTIIDHETRIDTLESQIGGENIENGTGTNAIQMKQDVTTIDYTGRNPNATAIDSTITGTVSIGAIGNQTSTLGKQTIATGPQSMAIGNKSWAKGDESLAQGYQSVALGNGSHAEGNITVSSGTCSHSEGNNTIASGEISHAEGFTTQAIGEGAHAEGAHTVARGNYSHAGGLKTEANYNGQTVVGHCNDNKETTVFEVGCGWTDENGNVQTRRNGFEVHLDGHAEVSFVPTDNDNAVPNMGTLIELENTLKQIINEVESTIPTNLSNGNPSQAGTNKNIQGGKDSIADYDGDFVFGTGLRNTMENQAVFGKYNDNTNWNPNRPLLIVGNGTSDSDRKNAFEVYLDGHAEVQSAGTTNKSVINRQALINYVNSKLGIWAPTRAPVSTTITSAKGKSWECQYQVFKNTLTNKSKVEYTLYSLTEETATAELISFNLIATVTIGASYVTDTIGYANLPKPIEGDTYWTFDSFTFDEATDIGNQCTILPFRGSGGFETRILVVDENPPASITFKKVIAKVTLYEK